MPVLIVFILSVILFTPFFVRSYLYYDNESKRLCFALYLYVFIKLAGGYIEKNDKRLVMHYSNKRASILNKPDVNKIKVKKNDLRLVWVTDVKMIVSLPFTAENCNLAGAVAVTGNVVFPSFENRYDFIKLKSNVVLGRDEKLKLYLKTGVVTNLLMIIILIIKMAVRK